MAATSHTARRLAANLVFVTALAGCAGEPQPTNDKVVYGNDDRREALGTGPEGEVTPLVVALVDGGRIATDGSFEAPTLAQAYGVCDSEPFAAQPALARCTGVFVDDDLVLTAAHCVRTTADCAGTRFVRGFDVAVGGTLETTGIHECVTIAYRHLDQGETLADWAFVQVSPPLDGDVEWPAVDEQPPTPGSRLTVVGHPSGLPMKFDEAALFIETTPTGALRLASDTYEGSSGSPVLGDDGLVGLLVSGAADWQSVDGCRTSQVLDESAGAEQAIRVSSAVEELCASGWPSERLCDRGPTCGDRICSLGEEAECPDDCAERQPRCGDGVCEQGDCAEDCASGSPVPEAWVCGELTWDSRDGCDCECGVPDPDCETALTTYNCDVGEVCSSEGRCVPLEGAVPESWTCNDDYFASGDGCDCGCGAPDPDCEDPAQEVLHCDEGETCDADGACFDPAAASIPEAWTCSPSWYAAGDDCDCACGAYDPDCSNGSLPVLGCDDGETCSITGECEIPPEMEPPIGYGCAASSRRSSPALLLVALLLRRRRSRQRREG